LKKKTKIQMENKTLTNKCKRNNWDPYLWILGGMAMGVSLWSVWSQNKFNYTTKLLQTTEDFRMYNSTLLEFEKRLSSYYPLGEKDSFRITHAPHYVSFFQRIGKPFCILLFDQENMLIGTCFIVKKQFPDCWYLADLKIDKKHRKLGLVYYLYKTYYDLFTKINKSGFGVTMNGGSSSQRMQSIARSLGCNSSKLYIYFVDDKEIQNLIDLKILRFQQFINLKQKKELILKSSETVLPLLHGILQPPDQKNFISSPIVLKGYMYMFCCQEECIIYQLEEQYKLKPYASAVIYSKNMSNDFSFLNTSEI
jgi:hypothetical protein